MCALGARRGEKELRCGERNGVHCGGFPAFGLVGWEVGRERGEEGEGSIFRVRATVTIDNGGVGVVRVGLGG